MGEITVDPNRVLKLLNNLKIHKASGPDGLSARVLKECSSEIAPILALIYNESLAVQKILTFFMFFSTKNNSVFDNLVGIYLKS